MPCSIKYAKSEQYDKVTKELKERQEPTRGDELRKAQKAFNSFIRARDSGNPCISCGRDTGCKINAGHYRSVGSCPELRFNEDNVHLQCEQCNNFKSGNIRKYRTGLIEKIGLERVEFLEGPHDAKHYSIEEIKSINRRYAKLARDLEKQINEIQRIP